MKNYLLLLFAAVLISATGCQKDVNMQKVMENEAQRKEVFDIIIQNPEMHKQLMAEHKKSGKMDMMMDKHKMEKGMMMKKDSTQMMGGMDKAKMHQMMQKMMKDCSTDPENCEMMSKMMMDNREMMMNMMQKMHQGGMIDDACMQKMKQKMKQ
jgi:hypothetical protein